jgi:hypothetical protein
VRDDRGALVRKSRIPARVIVVVMRIYDETHRLVGDSDALQSSRNLGCERGVFVVDEYDPVFTHQCGYIAGIAGLKQVDIAGDLRDLDFGLAQIRHRLCRRREGRDQQRKDGQDTVTNDEHL